MLKIPKQVDIKSAYIQDAYQALEESLIEMLIKRLANKSATELSEDTVFQWQMEKMQELRMMNDETIRKLVESNAKVTKQQLKELIEKDGYDYNVEANRELVNLMDADMKEWSNLDLILNQYFESQWLDLDNHVNQTLISTNYQHNALAKMYQQVLNDTVAKTLTGFHTPQQALKSAIYDMVSKGVMSSFIDKSGREWSLERYVRMVIKSTTGRVYNDLRTERGINEYGIVTALMSSKAAAREACAPIQGKFVLMVPTDEAPEEYRHLPSVHDHGYKDPGGTAGINCGHRFYSMLPQDETGIPGPPSAEDAIANAKVVAKQRRMEVAIRNAKKQLKAAETLEDEEGITYFKNLIRNRQGALRQLINDNSDLLHRDYSREAVYSRVSESVIDDQKEMLKQDKDTYKKMVSALGDYAPQTLEEYRKIRYNDKREADVFETIANSTKSNVRSMEQKQAALRTYQQFKIDGVTLSDHAVEQYQYRMRHEKSGRLLFNYQSILNASSQDANYFDGGRFIKFYGKVALITEDNGRVVSIYHVNKARKKWKPI